MRKKAATSWFFNRALSSLLFTIMLHSAFLDGPLRATSDVVERVCGPLATVGCLLALGLLVYPLVYHVATPILSVGIRRDVKRLISKVCTIMSDSCKMIYVSTNRRSRSQLEAEVLLLRDTLAEHRSLSRSQRTTLTQLVNSHARAIDACRTLQDAERTKYGGAIKRLAEAKEEILAFEFRVFIIDQDLATLDLELKKEKHERLGVEAALEMEKRDRSSLDGQLQIEKASRVELGQQLNDAYAEVASAMGLCLDTESTVSLTDKLERMMRRFRTVRTDNDALQVTLESALFDSCTMDATIAELESENSILADAGDEKDKSIEAFNTEKTQLLREASELRVEVDQLARAGLDKDAVITKLAEEKLRWVLASHVWDAENTILREENTRLSCDIRVKDGKISELVDEKQRLQETVDAFSCSLVSYNFEDRAKDETIGALKDEMRLMEDSIVEKDEAAAMLGECIDRLRDSSEALCNTIERLQDESLVKDMRVKMSEEMLDALHGSLEFVYLEQKAKVGALLPERD